MSYLEKRSEREFYLHLYVKPNSRRQDISEDGDFLAVSLKSKARRNKANKELIDLLRKKLDLSADQIRFISGLRNEDKIIQLFFSEEINSEEIKDKLIT
ncbi:MAG: hypothetical protein BAJALOKI2v1_170012 [Promethearchaeota archaeon]|nr:MAG: hypothetical protein BAJALOKI2v1_170012 [Candidatus Lokiarchaeota archaeon]